MIKREIAVQLVEWVPGCTAVVVEELKWWNSPSERLRRENLVHHSVGVVGVGGRSIPDRLCRQSTR